MMQLIKLDTQKDILSLLYEFDEVFPHLKEKVSDYNAYALKLNENAFVYKAMIENKVFGILVFYANDSETQKAYVSLIGVKAEYRSMGLGKYLLEQCEEISQENGMTSLLLEVDADNNTAICFYQRNGFEYYETASKNSMYMKKKIGCV